MTKGGPQGLDRGLTNYGDRDFARYLRRSMARSMGLSTELLDKPVVGIATSPSEFNNCHRYMPELAEAVARGVLAAGGLPRAFPTISLGEVFLNPTSMMFRNLMSMDVEEMIRAQPMDAVVLIGGCDKTVPAQLMGAASANRPAIQLVTGPMMTGRYRGERLGACTDCRRFWAKYRAGEIDRAEDRRASKAGSRRRRARARSWAPRARWRASPRPSAWRCPARRPFRRCDSQRLVAAEETGKTAVRLAHSPITPVADHHASVGRECVPRADVARRLDQRHRASDRRSRAVSASASRPRASTRSRTKRPCSST